MINLKNKKAVITGATGGIGYSILEKFYSEGVTVLGSGTNEEKLNKLKNDFNGMRLKKFDISKHDEIEKFVETVCDELKGCPDILINNAGITKDNLSLRMSQTEWQQVIDINLTSTFLLCKFFLKKMIKNKSGKIINITSVVGHTGNVGQANYAASKSGIIGMSKSLALEYAKKNININCISPGFIKTNMTDKIDEKFKELILAKIPSNRLGEPSDVANVAAFLSSEMSNYITGETIHVNGGMYLG
ncbi:3-oxoacyl-[acyl-carrier-protein] reductase [Candidatus Pelagibacter sp.]|nr:3-oxoacyl-[acyl-carrier-protein] reductase [Candidatus Pelagibacter sp.]|tara:strand:- start:246 stop:983 length:738 start_codon:yes stop_codon:yes gene_type:complete